MVWLLHLGNSQEVPKFCVRKHLLALSLWTGLEILQHSFEFPLLCYIVCGDMKQVEAMFTLSLRFGMITLRSYSNDPVVSIDVGPR